jgi:hypothetical protein
VAVTFALAPAGVEPKATVISHPWGTGIWFDASHLPAGTYAAWVERNDGSHVPAGTFRAGPSGQIHCYFTASAELAGSVAMGLTDERGATVVRGTLS